MRGGRVLPGSAVVVTRTASFCAGGDPTPLFKLVFDRTNGARNGTMLKVVITAAEIDEMVGNDKHHFQLLGRFLQDLNELVLAQYRWYIAGASMPFGERYAFGCMIQYLVTTLNGCNIDFYDIGPCKF